MSQSQLRSSSLVTVRAGGANHAAGFHFVCLQLDEIEAVFVDHASCESLTAVTTWAPPPGTSAAMDPALPNPCTTT